MSYIHPGFLLLETAAAPLAVAVGYQWSTRAKDCVFEVRILNHTGFFSRILFSVVKKTLEKRDEYRKSDDRVRDAEVLFYRCRYRNDSTGRRMGLIHEDSGFVPTKGRAWAHGNQREEISHALTFLSRLVNKHSFVSICVGISH